MCTIQRNAWKVVKRTEAGRNEGRSKIEANHLVKATAISGGIESEVYVNEMRPVRE